MDKNPDEFLLWFAEDLIRDEDRRDEEMAARVRSVVRG